MTHARAAAIVACRMPRARLASWILAVALGCGLAAAIVRLAWLSDDAYITLRCVENLVRGHGPVWNVGERVQTYTHPLWFWLLAAGRALSGEHYFTTLGLSFALTGTALLVLARTARQPLAIAAVFAVLLASRAFGDYATSGLETPLVLLLLALLGAVDAATPPNGTRCRAVAVLVGLLLLTRLDLAVLAAPVVLVHAWHEPPRRAVAVLALGFLPLALWSAFATFYYGSPFPITAYAKAFAPGIAAGELFAQGWRYLVHTATHDPVTLAVLALGVVVALLRPALRGRALALGALLGAVYVVRVGGDFMAGRFFVPPFAVAVVLLARWLANARPAASLAVLVGALGLAFVPSRPAYLSSPVADTVPAEAENGIQDERRFYYKDFGLLSPARAIPDFGRFSVALRRQGRTRPIVLGSGMAGGIPFVAGELFHFIDPWLCDPLLMRLPVADPANWRIGHFTRAIPDGYPESLAFADNRLENAELRAFYADLREVVRAPLGDGARWTALLALLAGSERQGLADYVEAEYRSPVRAVRPLADFAAPVADGTFWFDDEAVHCVPRGGWRIELGAARAVTSLRLAAVPLVRYRFTFRSGGAEVGHSELLALIDPGVPPAGDDGDVLGYLRRLLGARALAVELPAGLPPCDAIDVVAEHEPWLVPAIGALQLGR